MKILTIKSKLETVLPNNDLKLRKFVHLSDLVFDLNIIKFDGYKFANFFVLRCLEQKRSLPRIDEKFFTYALNTVSHKLRQSGRVQLESFDQELIAGEYIELFDENYFVSRANRSHHIGELAKEMLTATKKHLKENFFNQYRN